MRASIGLILAVFVAAFVMVGGSGYSYAQACVTSSPFVSISPSSLSADPGDTLSYTVSVNNRDSSGCLPRDFTIEVQSADFSFFVSQPTITIIPGESKNVLIDVSIPSSTPPGTKTFSVLVNQASDLATAQASIDVREEVATTCNIRVDTVDVFEERFSTPDTNFCSKDKLKVRAGISNSGDLAANMNVKLIVNGKVEDTRTVNMPSKGFGTFFFDRLIDTEALGLTLVNVRVEATASCDEDVPYVERRVTVEDCEDQCVVRSSIAAPSQQKTGPLTSSLYVVNNGGEAELTHVDVFLCKEGSCSEVSCGDGTFTLERGEYKTISCESRADIPGKYQFKVETLACGSADIDYSREFEVSSLYSPTPTTPSSSSLCEERALDEYYCSGNIRQRAFQRLDCSKEINDVEYCPLGCSSGSCIKTESLPSARPEITMPARYDVASCGLSYLNFAIKNTGSSSGTFKIISSGEASSWIKVVDRVALAPGEERDIQATLYLPCGIPNEEYQFTMLAGSGTSQTAVPSNVVVKSSEPGFPKIDLGNPGIIFAIAVLILFAGLMARRVFSTRFQV